MNVFELENDHRTTTVMTNMAVERILDDIEYGEEYPLLWDSSEDPDSPLNLELKEAILFLADGYAGFQVYDGVAKFGEKWYFLDIASEEVIIETDLTDELVEEIKKSTGFSYA